MGLIKHSSDCPVYGDNPQDDMPCICKEYVEHLQPYAKKTKKELMVEIDIFISDRDRYLANNRHMMKERDDANSMRRKLASDLNDLKIQIATRDRAINDIH